MKHVSKIYLLVLLLTALHFDMYGWEISKSKQLPRIGDEFSVDMYEGVLPGKDEKDCIWDFSGAVSKGETQKISVIGFDDRFITVRYPHYRMYYGLSGDTLLWHGYETRQILLTDTIGTPAMVYTMSAGDSCVGKYNFNGKYALERPVANQGIALLKSSGHGMLILPDGDTVRNVIRICREYRGIPRLGRTARLADSTDTTTFSPVTYREYDWYAKGYRYPVFSLRQAKTVRGNEEIEYGDSFAWCFSRHSQQIELKDDENNEQERDETMNDNKSYNDDINGNNETPPFKDLQITDHGSTLTIEFENVMSDGWLELIVSDTGGIPYITVPRHRLTAGHNTVSVNLSRLPEGEYAVLLNNGETRLSQTFTHR